MSVHHASLGLACWPARGRLRELNGFDEQSVCRVDTATAISLLDRLLIRAPGSISADFKAVDLTASERDRLLAEVYERTFGSRIESTTRCTLCDQLFDLTFEIEDLAAACGFARSSSSQTDVCKEPDGTFLLPSGLRFRLPTGEDEMAVIGLPPDQAELALLDSCIVESEKGVDLDVVQQAMEDVGPVLNIDLDAQCPECRGKQLVHFDVQFYLLRALEQQNKQVAREIHCLAVAYGWSLNEILSLSRTQRRTFVGFVEADPPARTRSSL